MECLKLVSQYLEAEHARWNKFDCIERTDPYVAGMTRWDKYARQVATDPTAALCFPNRRNVLTRNHPEQQQVNYALSLALDYLLGPGLAPSMRAANERSIAQAASLLRARQIRPCTAIATHASDSNIIRELKLRANNVLGHTTAERCAWRIDQAEFFERYVQHVCREAGQRIGLQVYPNRRFPIRGPHTPWGLAYLEPDIVMEGPDRRIVIDAKYKGHLAYGSTQSEILAGEFRHDLHQLLAYAAIAGTTRAMLIYPSARPHKIPLTIENIQVTLLGLPISLTRLPDAIVHLAATLA